MAEMEEVQFGGTQWKKCMIQIIVLQRLNEKYEREIDGEIRKNYINSYNISVGNLRKLLNIYENFRQPNRNSLCVRGIFSVYKRTSHPKVCNIKCKYIVSYILLKSNNFIEIC